MEMLQWAFVLLLLAFTLAALELFVPSGGVLSVLAMAAVSAAIVLAFWHSRAAGSLLLLGLAVLLPLLGVSAARWWPDTPLGRRLLIGRPDSQDDVLPETEEYRGRQALVGKRGRARSPMLPSGEIAIEGRAYDAVAAGVAIERGQEVVVVGVNMNRLIVRPVEPGEAPAAAVKGDDALAQPLDELGLGDLREPLA